MTTIVYRDGVMAADTRISTSDDHIAPGRMIKIRRNGLALVGLSGDPGYWDALLAYLDGRAKLPEWGDDARALVASAAGIQTINKGGPVFLAAPFAAIGSGQSAAWAAMYMGADARRAVEIAMLVDPFSGGEIDVLELDGGIEAAAQGERVPTLRTPPASGRRHCPEHPYHTLEYRRSDDAYFCSVAGCGWSSR